MSETFRNFSIPEIFRTLSSIKTINKNMIHTFLMNDVTYAASRLSCDCEAASADLECIK